jgi:membrane protease YdiL (CAAX protease family)
LAWAIVAAAAFLVGHQVWQDSRQYPRFKAMTETVQRQAMLRYWLADNFIRYGVLGVVGLLLLSRQDALIALPAAVAAERDNLAASVGLGPGFVVQAGYIVAGVVTAWTLLTGVLPFMMKIKVVAIGDVVAMMPRNAAELGWTGALAVNAGISEEIFFRLTVTLALYAATGNVLIAVAMASVLFCTVHVYQGVVGAAAAVLFGLLMTYIWLSTGQIWLAIGLHALMDLRGLVAIPIAMGVLRKDSV